jgi:hypothetical protein
MIMSLVTVTLIISVVSMVAIKVAHISRAIIPECSTFAVSFEHPTLLEIDFEHIILNAHVF